MFHLQEYELEKLYFSIYIIIFSKIIHMNRNVSVKNAKAQISIKELTHTLKSTWTIIAKICSHLSWFTFFVLRVICLLYSRMT